MDSCQSLTRCLCMHDEDFTVLIAGLQKLFWLSVVNSQLKMQFKDDPKSKSRQSHHANSKSIMQNLLHYVYNRFKINKQINDFVHLLCCSIWPPSHNIWPPCFHLFRSSAHIVFLSCPSSISSFIFIVSYQWCRRWTEVIPDLKPKEPVERSGT